MDNESFHDTYRVQNDQNRTQSVVLEPWGEVLEVLPKQTLVFTATSPVAGSFEVLEGHDKTTVWAWEGAIVTITDGDGHNLDAGRSPRPPVPPFPPGYR